MKKISFTIAFLAIFSVLSAQTKDSRWAVGLHTNFTEYQGDLGNEFLSFEDIDPGIGLSLGYYLSPSFDLTAKVTYFDVDYTDTDGTYGRGNRGYADKVGTRYGDWGFNGDMWASALNLKFKLNNGWLFKEEAAISPFAIGGIGFTRIHSESTRDVQSSKTYSNMAFYYGGGLNLRLSDRWNMILEAGIYNPMTDVYDGIDKGTSNWSGADNSNDQFLQYSLGVTYSLGKRVDSDGDGVFDKDDKCPNTPIGVAVDKAGCPIDTDGDGVADYLDKCPAEAGTVEGCPDKDGDGVIDKKDKCPDVAGLKELDGCPDADDDKDGVLNLSDKCPETPAGVQVDSKGCPVDTDGDGIADYLDKCPNEEGPEKTQGCPVQKQLNEFAKQIYFNFDKATVKSESLTVLDQVVEMLQKHADGAFTVTIDGHTDNRGSDVYNQKLSEKRAAAVKDYLISKGMPAEKLHSRGYGETRPIASNKTKEGRAQNRRTEIIVE